MKITKSRLKEIIREELIEAKESHQHFKFPDKRNAEDFAQEIANSALATGKVKGDTVAVDTSKVRRAKTHKAIAKVMEKFGGRLDFKITFESLNEAKDFYLMDVGTAEVQAFYLMKRGEHTFGPKFYGQRFSSKREAEKYKKELNRHKEHRGRTLRVVTGGDNDPAESIVTEETICEKESKFDHDIFFGLQKLISNNAKNNKLKGYSSEVAHAVTDILTSVEEDRLAIGEVFNGLKNIIKKIKK